MTHVNLRRDDAQIPSLFEQYDEISVQRVVSLRRLAAISGDYYGTYDNLVKVRETRNRSSTKMNVASFLITYRL
jgi:hypothetical protein